MKFNTLNLSSNDINTRNTFLEIIQLMMSYMASDAEFNPPHQIDETSTRSYDQVELLYHYYQLNSFYFLSISHVEDIELRQMMYDTIRYIKSWMAN